MFAEIAPRYDLLNRFLSFGIDARWRRRAVRELALPKQAELLDLCCGTGDLALAFARTGISVTGADFTGPMLPLALRKSRKAAFDINWVQADAQSLPFDAASFDGLTIAFGIRNVEDPRLGLRECLRVLRPGGQLAILEFFPVPNRVWGFFFRTYFHRVLPLFAGIVRAGRTGAYRYLPESVEKFATHEQFADWMLAEGFESIRDIPLTGGVARLMIGRAPEVRS
ncbi:MAG: ubiquinone/menaquinone biosynthesis methyltransferase [Planctomycetes bacterium]|nr:ubiquinone/menaquinone biosynthesis methyltransferase [Planctomycetota bacterium]MBT4028376.1 ubiquinone/menaquinone biosynthesis methyltransferase [Planctomycetota bacterium]MBT4561024.1 ubiquinone/menaquinone biosynthesis methyltransferase [Planctomycetota bacterium]MBT5100599.1 ubiquinone/menaquinone biosynthesis methyltransferase [Planctomycetota bacterium]MBT7012524.1 ubiquinone/menaquinone biosynthesis methyltransferase [Planctomycetota bacterium]